jgi:flagellar basal body-associated protein FliL
MAAARPATTWIAVTAGVVAVLIAVFAVFAWQGRDDAAAVAKAAAGSIPDIRPQLPREPHLPQPPIPIPK